MPWPQSTDYNLAIQNPHLCFRDEELRGCVAYSADPVLGLPTPRSGNFADVYRLDHPNGNSWAVKCFTREVADLQDRYTAISEHLRQSQRSFMVDFRYLSDAILVDGVWYPIVKMRWIEGKNLSEIVGEHADRPGILDKLARKWLKLAVELREAKIGHGDLQHGNVLLVPGSQRGKFILQLIDYDGMYVPALADRPSAEAGFPGFQHPGRRSRNLFGPEVDRFSHLVIYTALQAVRSGGQALWNRFGTPENLLFTESDFRAPAQSELLRTLFTLQDASLRHLLGHLILAALGEPEDVPQLEHLVSGGTVKRLEVAEFEQLRGILDVLLARRRSKLEVPPPVVEQAEVPPLPAPLRPEDPSFQPIPLAPVARRLEAPTGLPDWMLPEALPLTAPTPEPNSGDDSDPEIPPLLVPPLVLVPMEPMERPLPPIPQFHAVLIEETDAGSQPVTLPDSTPAAGSLPILDVTEVVPDEPPLDVIELEEEPGSSGVGVVLIVVPVFLFLVFLAILVIRQYRVPPTPPSLLRAPEQLVIQGGESAVLTVEFELPDRERGPFQVKLFDLPSPLKGRADPVEVSQTAGDARVVRYHIDAPLNAPENSVNLRVQLHRLDTVVEERVVRLIVHRADLPRLVEVVSPRRIEVGGRTRFTFDVDRRGYRQKLYLDLLNLPRSINRDPAEPGGEGGQLSLNLHVPGSLQGDTVVTYLRLMMQSEEPDQPDFEVDRARLALEFVAPRPSRPFLQADRRGVEISQGGEATLRVQVDRKLFGRPLRLSLRNLPVGITANDASVTTSSESGVFLLTATPQTALTPGPVPVDIVAYDGLDEIGKIQTTLRVTPQDSVENP